MKVENVFAPDLDGLVIRVTVSHAEMAQADCRDLYDKLKPGHGPYAPLRKLLDIAIRLDRMHSS